QPKAKACRAGVLHPVGTQTSAFAAVARGKTVVYRKASGATLASFDKLNANGYPTTFSIVGAVVDASCSAAWYRVEVPLRPNGAKGYVRPRDVFVQKVATKIEVDLSARTLTLFRGGRVMLTTPVA